MTERRSTPIEAKNRLQNRILYGLGGLAIIFCLWTTILGDNGLLRLYDLHRTRSFIQSENHRMLMENLLLQDEIRALSNPRVIEQHAREKLGYTRANEVVFIVE